MKPTCERCRFAVYQAWRRYDCRRDSPGADPGNEFARVWPQVDSDDWCGEFEASSEAPASGH